MFQNIGGKIKSLAVLTAFAGIITSVISGLAMIISEELVYQGFLVLILGSLISWIATFLLYGYGEIIEKISKIADNLNNSTNSKNDGVQTISGFETTGILDIPKRNKGV